MRRVADRVGVAGRSLGARMGLPHQAVFAAKHVQFLTGRSDVIDLAVGGVVLGELLVLAADQGPVNRMRHEADVVAAESVIGLLAGNQQKAAIGEAAAAVEVNFLLLESDGAGIGGMRIGMKIGQDRHVDPQAAENLEPTGLQVHGAGVGQLLVEVHVEMADQNLVARHALVTIVVGEGEHGFLRRTAVFRAQVKIDRHALPGSGRGVVEREVIGVVTRFAGAAVPHFV